MNNEAKIKEDAIYWVMCEKEGLDENQKKEFHNWLLEDENHQKVFNRMKFVHNMSKSLSKQNAQTLSQEAHKQISKDRFFKKIKSFSTLAASLLILCFFAFKVYENSFKVQFSKSLLTDTKTIKEQLPDGSNILIDAKTNLNIEFFNDKRVVYLVDGRAMFEVEKDENRPFIIKSDDVNIEVVGTKFEVIHKKDTTTINVQEGRVKTYHLGHFFDKKNEIFLTKENSLTYSNDNGSTNQISIIKADTIAPWTENRVLLDKTKLKEALEEFSKYSDVSVVFSSKEIEDYLITGEFNSTQLDIFLKTVTKIYPIKIDKKEKELRISKR
ncbi:sigma factor regulatory protein, FecR family [Aliarcobacter faecis]|uniref:FecR family protein n=1 Tax=Aliarcobacter faecis TaxID=1564138 RepID=UPI00047C140D|nr:FecR domain-containing protein [Aliarcobacter faecis]QKF72884.1 sigma factor regulatory protein, FecR family [Aliarcobacter faecis]